MVRAMFRAGSRSKFIIKPPGCRIHPCRWRGACRGWKCLFRASVPQLLNYRSTCIQQTGLDPFVSWLFNQRLRLPGRKVIETEKAGHKQIQIAPHLLRCLIFLVAGEGFEPTTFGLWARRATSCSTPRRQFSFFTWCRRPESNRYDLEGSQDFKSCASANSATPAVFRRPDSLASPDPSFGSKGGTRTHSLSVNSRVLHHWATLEHRRQLFGDVSYYTTHRVCCQVFWAFF